MVTAVLPCALFRTCLFSLFEVFFCTSLFCDHRQDFREISYCENISSTFVIPFNDVLVRFIRQMVESCNRPHLRQTVDSHLIIYWMEYIHIYQGIYDPDFV